MLILVGPNESHLSDVKNNPSFKSEQNSCIKEVFRLGVRSFIASE